MNAKGPALQVDKEQEWPPKLAPLLPLPIPAPLAIGLPDTLGVSLILRQLIALIITIVNYTH
jgi:hypothetical protein